MIRILCADTSSVDERIFERLYESASEERKRRADRYRRYEDKLRCIMAEALLKLALNTNDFQIIKNKYGKPYVKNREGFYYNLSHSGQYVVMACGDSFAHDEMDYVWQSDSRIEERFYEIWTGKESYLKYIGTGLCGDMRSFSVRKQESQIRCLQHMPKDGYTFSFCSKDKAYTLELSDVRQFR